MHGPDKRLELSKKAISVREVGLGSLSFCEYPCPVPGNAALGVLGVHAPVIRCSLLSPQGQWSEILGALLLLERADSWLTLIGTQQGATPMMQVCVHECVSTVHEKKDL